MVYFLASRPRLSSFSLSPLFFPLFKRGLGMADQLPEVGKKEPKKLKEKKSLRRIREVSSLSVPVRPGSAETGLRRYLVSGLVRLSIHQQSPRSHLQIG